MSAAGVRRVVVALGAAVTVGGLGAVTGLALTVEDADVVDTAPFGLCSQVATVSWGTGVHDGDLVVERVVVAGDAEGDASCPGVRVSVQLLDGDGAPLAGTEELTAAFPDDPADDAPTATLEPDDGQQPAVRDVKGVAVLLEG